MMNKIKMGIVGAGVWGEVHAADTSLALLAELESARSRKPVIVQY